MREILKNIYNLFFCGIRFIAPPLRMEDTVLHDIPGDHNLDASFNMSNLS